MASPKLWNLMLEFCSHLTVNSYYPWRSFSRSWQLNARCRLLETEFIVDVSAVEGNFITSRVWHLINITHETICQCELEQAAQCEIFHSSAVPSVEQICSALSMRTLTRFRFCITILNCKSVCTVQTTWVFCKPIFKEEHQGDKKVKSPKGWTHHPLPTLIWTGSMDLPE